MKIIDQKILYKIVSLNRRVKNILLCLMDYLSLVFAFWLSLSLRVNEVFIPDSRSIALILIFIFFSIPILYFAGQYKSLIRYIGLASALSSLIGMSIFTFLLYAFLLISDLPEMPINFLLIFWLSSIFILNNTRFILRAVLTYFLSTSPPNIMIYGAGSAGRQLAAALKVSDSFNPIGFLDNNKDIQRGFIDGLEVFSPVSIGKLINKKKIKEIHLAIPSINQAEANNIINSLKEYPIKIRQLPNVSELAEGKVSISDLKKIKIEDLLMRDIVQPDSDLMEKNIKDKAVLVTGAGGSIGSELCRQIIKFKPRKLILFEINEYSLYLIEQEIRNNIDSTIELIPILGDVNNQKDFQNLLQSFKVLTIYHTAAYKHVPMLEQNGVAGIRNNIFGTYSAISASIKANVECFVFISTDKAVRPTNLMGASKRFAEILLQAKSKPFNLDNKKTKISIVRFGNVLGSSGSVVPLFEKQIKKGGPLTVTDENIYRYFMTIQEAVELVIQAGSMGSNGDIFLLDMGEPVGIYQLAKDMIFLSGKTVKDHENPHGDIEILFTGLRPGEKLYEELLINQDAGNTKHEKIMLAHDTSISLKMVDNYLHQLEQQTINNHINGIKEILLEVVEGFKPQN